MDSAGQTFDLRVGDSSLVCAIVLFPLDEKRRSTV